MNLYQLALMEAPDLTPPWCVVCGSPANNRHHVVPRSQGGHKGPKLTLCGSGCTGCHGAAHDHLLHFRYEIRHGESGYLRWEYLVTVPAVKYDEAIDTEGWRACR